MSWTRVFLGALAVCALFGALLLGATGCGSRDAHEDEEVNPSPVGKVLEDTDEEGRHYREVNEKNAPEVAIEIQPDAEADGWDVRLTVSDFRFTPAGTRKTAVQGRGHALLRIDGRPLAFLRDPAHHIAGGLVARGTHQVTVRLHADDDTVWAVGGEPVGSTADITVSDPMPTGTGSAEPGSTPTETSVSTPTSTSISISTPTAGGAAVGGRGGAGG